MTPTLHPLTPLLAAELRAARGRARRTLASVAEQSGVSTRTVIRIFNGERAIDAATLHLVGMALDTTGATLLADAEKRLLEPAE